MVTTKFEDTYVSVQNAKRYIKNLDKVVEFLKEAGRPVTAREVGTHIWGEYEYVKGYKSRSYSSSIGQIMRHLVENKFIKISYIDGEPVEYITHKWIEDPTPRYIKAYDAQGREYDVLNPDYDWQDSGHFEEVKKTLIPKIKCYEWVC